MTYRRAKALDKLVEQINARYPNRDKRSDGWIGDAVHASKKSDHNPWVKITEGRRTVGIVTAQDIDRELAPDKTVDEIVNALIDAKDSRIKYIIWNSRMISSYPAHGYKSWQWRPYSGSNRHTHHVHISVKETPAFFDDVKDWDLDTDEFTEVQPMPEPYESNKYTVQRGDSLWKIAQSFKTTVDQLKRINDLRGDLIRPGQVLKVRC